MIVIHVYLKLLFLQTLQLISAESGDVILKTNRDQMYLAVNVSCI